MSIYSFYDKEEKLIDEIEAYTRDTAIHIFHKKHPKIDGCMVKKIKRRKKKEK